MSKLYLRLTAAIAAAIAVSPAVAHAELPNGAELVFDKLMIHEDGGSLKEPSDPDALRHYLNLAHCVCSKAGAGKEQSLSYRLTSTADTNTNRPVELWVGTSCDDETLRATRCRSIQTIPDIDVLATIPETVEVSLYDVFTGFDNTAACPTREGDAFLWTLVDSNGDATYDYIKSKSIGVTTDVTKIDTQAPPVPTEFEGASAESAIRLSWKAPTSNVTDVYAYQVMCAKLDGTPALAKPSNEPLYETASDLCGVEQTIALTDTPITGGDATTSPVPDGIKQLDKSFICGESKESTTTGLLIDGLENNVPYAVALLSIDRYGNATGVAFTTTITPRPATDFWEDLHDRGSNVEGGFCVAGAVGGTGGGSGAALIALALTCVLVRRKRIHARKLAGTVVPALALLLLAPHAAHAQSITPYWDEPQRDDDSGVIEGTVKWNVGIRVGPYVPQIDKQFGQEPGPYHEMFGGYKIVPMLDIDRIVWRGFGQLGFGGSIGYMQNSASAWADGSTPGMPDRPRSEGDKNVFRLLPLALTATYRLTVLDDEYGIPVVPYIRGGLAYYVWWLRTNGNTAEACWDGSHTSNCDADKALGATVGVVGSIGLAVRAERVDANAAISMRQSGIEHAGFYAELSLAKVDGFGSDYKLSVGDTTWFAGVNFEF